jgi:hypothetical protein
MKLQDLNMMDGDEVKELFLRRLALFVFTLLWLGTRDLELGLIN